MANILEKIVTDKRPEIDALKREHDLEEFVAEAAGTPHPRDFKAALVRPNRVTLIAELKKASPSKGLLREDYDLESIAEGYVRGGAAALSVLTEDNYFQGSREYTARVRGVVDQPILRKDFIVDPIQVPESRILGADAILLITTILSDEMITELLVLTKKLKLAALCEVHDAEEMRRVAACGADLIGINNRDLRTFEVDLQTTFDLMPLAPEGVVTISESGIRGHADLEVLRDAGVDAVLVGETLIRQPNVEQAVRNLYDPSAPVPEWE